MANRPTVVALGEILWDVFPDGPKFGGAPANFACTSAELAGGTADIYIVGAVGNDALGHKAIELLASHGVNTTCVSQVAHPTGQVNVTLDDAGKPTFEIAENTAWDHVEWSNELDELVGSLEKVYEERRVSVITLIYSKPVDKVRTFADAFRLRKD